jgi:hypothetical protein
MYPSALSSDTETHPPFVVLAFTLAVRRPAKPTRRLPSRARVHPFPGATAFTA